MVFSPSVDEILNDLLLLPTETEWLEFKEAKGSFDFDDLGKYFSALSNEANLFSRSCGWLVLGITNAVPRHEVGTAFKSDPKKLQRLKHDVATHVGNGMTFSAIHNVERNGKRVLMFEIPPALPGVPTSWKGHYYGRDGESLVALNIAELERIRAQSAVADWSKEIVEAATLDDLDDEAIRFARRQYAEKNPKLANDVATWPNETFLNKARVCINGMITRAALVLLGRAEASHLLSPVDARMSWILKSVSGVEKDYEHFFPPFVLATDKLLAKIRNIKVRQMPSGTLFPHEIEQYDQWVLRESLHNCIAHQDYRISGRIVVTETEDAVEFSNQGAFLPGTVESVVTRDAPTERPLNPFLSTAMLNLNMIDTIGSGIKRMFRRQAERAFPLPDYDLATSNRVVVRIEGRVIDERYTQLLLTRTDLDLLDVIALDRVQRRLRLEDEAFRSLKSKGLVEGRRPNLFVSAAVAKATGREVEYVRNRGLAESHYETLVEDLLRQFGPSKRAKIDELLLDRLPDLMDAKQRKRYVANLLQKMKKKGKLSLEGTTRWGLWSISKTRNSQTSS